MKPVYRTTDGSEFSTQEDAIAHENVSEAYQSYQDAVANLQKAIAEKLVTADGHPFKIGGHTNYYYIAGVFSSSPRVVDVVVSYHNFELYNHDFCKIKAEYYADNKMNEIFCEIECLYKSPQKAIEKLIHLLEGKKVAIDDLIQLTKKNCL